MKMYCQEFDLKLYTFFLTIPTSETIKHAAYKDDNAQLETNGGKKSTNSGCLNCKCVCKIF